MSGTLHFGVIGGSVWGNRGAEAMVATCVGHLRRNWPEAQVHVFSYLPRQDSRLVEIPGVDIADGRPLALVLRLLPFALLCRVAQHARISIPDSWLPRDVRSLRRCRVLLDAFGISFADGRELFLPFNVLSILPAFLMGVPVVKMSQALGPFRNRLNRTAARAMLPRCQHVFARGRQSASYLADLGLMADQFSTAGDLAFLYRDSDSMSREGEVETGLLCEQLTHIRDSGGRIVALSPSSVVHGKARKAGVDYVALFCAIVRRILATDAEVVVLPNATRGDRETRRNNDLPLIRELRERCSAKLTQAELDRTHWVQTDLNTRGIRALISKSDLLVASRFHAMIAALAQYVPVLVVGWSHKYHEVLEHFDLGRSAFDIATLEPAVLFSRLDEMMDADFRAGWTGANRLAAMRQLSEVQFAWLDAFVRDVGPSDGGRR